MLFVQVALAVAALWLLRARVFPAVREPGHSGLILDVWGPIAVVAPMLFAAGRIDGSVGAVGWTPLGGPVACGVFALGAAMLGSQSGGEGPTPRMMAAWTAAGLVLLLLGSAHELTIWSGQCAFAAAALLLWVNMPPVPTARQQRTPSEHPRAVEALLLVLLCALGQGAAAMVAGPETISIRVVTMVYAGLAVALAARVAGAGACLRLGGWSATYGVLLGLGVISTVHLLPQTVRALRGDEGLVDVHVAYGFGRYALEATVLVGLGGLAVGARMLAPGIRRAAGVAVILAAVWLVAWRLAGM